MDARSKSQCEPRGKQSLSHWSSVEGCQQAGHTPRSEQQNASQGTESPGLCGIDKSYENGPGVGCEVQQHYPGRTESARRYYAQNSCRLAAYVGSGGCRGAVADAASLELLPGREALSLQCALSLSYHRATHSPDDVNGATSPPLARRCARRPSRAKVAQRGKFTPVCSAMAGSREMLPKVPSRTTRQPRCRSRSVMLLAPSQTQSAQRSASSLFPVS